MYKLYGLSLCGTGHRRGFFPTCIVRAFHTVWYSTYSCPLARLQHSSPFSSRRRPSYSGMGAPPLAKAPARFTSTHV